MRTITTIGLDIAKSVLQVHGVDAVGQVVIRRQLKRRYVLTFFQKLPSCLIGMEACGSPFDARDLFTRVSTPAIAATCRWPQV
jgi:transposase